MGRGRRGSWLGLAFLAVALVRLVIYTVDHVPAAGPGVMG